MPVFNKMVCPSVIAVLLSLDGFTTACDVIKDGRGNHRVVDKGVAPSDGNTVANADTEKTSDNETADTPQNITGVYLASFENSRLRCDYVQHAANNYVALCTVVVAQRDGSELKAVNIKPGVKLSWPDPQKVAGSAEISGCQSSKDNLSYSCAVTASAAAQAVQLLFALKIGETTKGERVETANLMLPYAVGVSAGYAPSVPFQYNGQTSTGVTLKLADTTPAEPQKVGFQMVTYPANSIDFSQPDAYCMRGDRLFFASGTFIYQLQNGVVTLYAGSVQPANAMNTSHRLRIAISPFDIMCDKDAIYVSSMSYCRILRITDDGPVEIVTGKQFSCSSSPDGTKAKDASQAPLTMLAMAPSGELIFAELTGKIRKIAADGTLRTLGDVGVGADPMDGTWTINNAPNAISGLAVDGSGNVFVADTAAQVVLMISTDGKITRAAGTGIVRFKNRDNPLALADPARLLIDTDGSLLIGETFRGIKRLKPDGSLAQVISAGDDLEFEMLRSPDLIRQVSLERPNFTGILLQKDGAWVTGGPRGVLRAAHAGAEWQYIVGNSAASQSCTRPLQANRHRFLSPTALAYGADGKLLIPDFKNIDSNQIVIWQVSQEGDTTYRRGLYGCDDAPLLLSQNRIAAAHVAFNDIGGIATTADGSVYFANAQRHQILKISSTGDIKTVAGNGKAQSSGDGGPAAAASVKSPIGGAVGPDGSFYFVEMGLDDNTSRIRKIAPNGVITTVAGAGPSGDEGEGGPASNAKLKATAVAIDNASRIFIADQGNGKVKMVDEKGLIHTIAGGGTAQFLEGSVEATQAGLSGPMSLAVAGDGTIYVVDNGLGIDEMKPRKDGKWDISVLFGRTQTGDCGTGRQNGTASMQNSADAVKNSLTIICQGVTRAITLQDTCSAKGGQVRLAFSQSFDDYANIVEVIKPCP